MATTAHRRRGPAAPAPAPSPMTDLATLVAYTKQQRADLLQLADDLEAAAAKARLAADRLAPPRGRRRTTTTSPNGRKAKR